MYVYVGLCTSSGLPHKACTIPFTNCVLPTHNSPSSKNFWYPVCISDWARVLSSSIECISKVLFIARILIKAL